MHSSLEVRNANKKYKRYDEGTIIKPRLEKKNENVTKKGIVHFSTKINAKWMDDVVAKNVKIRVFQI